ncbi:IS3 family transposase [Legionella lytica]|uniref:IS3 family transposase n=1 Tax=Legionella lytica TaxID=96232 RepID=A0ABY4Y7L9_9GAMM|nr:IS3 family transposase [Legionella lytica]
MMESFYHTLKTELIYGEKIKTRAETQLLVFDYIEVFYNRQRLHSTLDFIRPQMNFS